MLPRFIGDLGEWIAKKILERKGPVPTARETLEQLRAQPDNGVAPEVWAIVEETLERTARERQARLARRRRMLRTATICATVAVTVSITTFLLTPSGTAVVAQVSELCDHVVNNTVVFKGRIAQPNKRSFNADDTDEEDTTETTYETIAEMAEDANVPILALKEDYATPTYIGKKDSVLSGIRYEIIYNINGLGEVKITMSNYRGKISLDNAETFVKQIEGFSELAICAISKSGNFAMYLQEDNRLYSVGLEKGKKYKELLENLERI